jgi:hypothetical protein
MYYGSDDVWQCTSHVVKSLGITVKKAVEKMSKQNSTICISSDDVWQCTSHVDKTLGITVKKAVEKM